MSTKKIFVFILVFALIIIPFFWLKPGEVNLGGDSSRGYLYEPFVFIKNYVLYGINAWNIGTELAGYFIIPFAAFLGLLMIFVKTPHNLVNVFNSFSFVLAFLATYGSIYAIIMDNDMSKKKNIGFIRTVSIIGGLFYLFSPIMTNWDKPLLTFNQVFLDPLMFFLIYKYVMTKKPFYALFAILGTFIFAPNFSFIGAPTFFSFYPFVFFILFFLCLIKKTSIPIKQFVFFILLMLGIHAFQLLPQFILLKRPDSVLSLRVFSQSTFNYVDYFQRIANGVNVTDNFLGLPQFPLLFGVSFFVFPFILVFALIQKVEDKDDIYFRKVYILIFLCYLFLLYFTSAKFTSLGFSLYENLFKIPGFGMFRNFTGQFMTAFSFFYSLTIATGLYIIYKNVKKVFCISITIFVFLILVVRGWPIVNGSILYLPILQSKISSPFIIPPSFEHALTYISQIPTDAKILALPLTDFGYLMVAGENGGMYIGSSLIGPLTLKQDFGNYSAMGILGDSFIQAIKSNDITTIKNILGVLNIQDIFWETNPFVYGTNFPNFPYQSTQLYLPTTVSAYQSFINLLPITQRHYFGKTLQVMHLDVATVLPKIFPSVNVLYTNNLSDTGYLLRRIAGQPNIVLPTQNFLENISSQSFQADLHDNFSGLYNNLQFHSAMPEVTWKPGSIVYPFVIWKEERSLKKLQSQQKMDVAYLYLAKRIEELGKWTNDIPILHKKVTWQGTSIKQLIHWSEYNSWEASFAHYESNANNIIIGIKQFPQDEILSQKEIAFEQFEQHRMRLQTIISGSGFSSEDKNYLLHQSNMLIDTLENNLKLEKIDITEKHYSVNLPKGAEGNYVLNISRISPEASISGLFIGGSQYNLINQQNNLVSSEQVLMSSGKEIPIILTTQNTNLINDTQWEGLGSVKKTDDSDVLIFDKLVESIPAQMVRQIPVVNSSRQYIISFLYNTHNVPFSIKIFDKRIKNQGEVEFHEYTTRQLISNDWKLFQTVFTIDPQTSEAYMEIESTAPVEPKEIMMKNLSVNVIENPIVTIQKILPQPVVGPTITFQRINPTKYHIFVNHADTAYVLTFLQAFSQGWKLYYKPASSGKNFSIIQSYFGGSVSEGGHTNTAFGNDLFETWFLHPIAEATHTTGDGYANSWIISPTDTGGKRDYELIIELNTQKYFYMSIPISVIAFLLILIWLLSDLFKNKIKVYGSK